MHYLKYQLIKVAFLLWIFACCNMKERQVSAAEVTYEIGTGNQSYHYSEILNRYKSNSASYAQNMLGYQIEELKYNLSLESSSSIDNQFATAVNKCAQLKELREEYIAYRKTLKDDAVAEIDAQIQALSEQIDQYNSTISSYKTSLAEANLQVDIEKFYVNYQWLINQEVQNKLLNNFMKKCYGLIILQEQDDYYTSYNEYLITVQKVERIKNNNGVSTQLSLDLADANLLKNDLALQGNMKSFYRNFNGIKTEIGIQDESQLLLPIEISYKKYSLEDTITRFEIRNVALAQFQHLKKCYQNYLSLNNGTYTLQRQIQLKIQDYQLQYTVLKNNLRTYVTQAIYSYDSEFQNLALADKEVQIAYKNYNIIITKKKYKNASELDIHKAKSELESAEVAYYQCLYNIILWQNILDEGIYGETPQS